MKILILVTGIIACLALFFYAKSQRPEYTAKATIFPLTNTTENSLTSNALSGILGLTDAPKSFSNEATINIIELSLSRFVREAVAATRLPSFGNKTITELMVQDFNAHHSFFTKDIVLPADSIALAIVGGEMMKDRIVAKMSKNGVLELYFDHQNKSLVSPISFALIDKVSQFYIDLKIKKATADYDFTVKKIDSLDGILNTIDKHAIHIQNTTLFAPEKLEYEIPKERVNADKQRYMRQRDISLNNQEEAIWRLQKQTPIISVLDKPTEPFTIDKPSAPVYALTGFIAGCLLMALLNVSGLLYRYFKNEIYKSMFGTDTITR
jgi:hypothetical protein